MIYRATLTREGRRRLAEFPDCPGCQTFAEPGENLGALAQDALEGWLRAHLLDGEAPPRPSKHRHPARGARLLEVEVSSTLAVKLSLRWARQDAGLTLPELARRAGVGLQQMAKLEHPRAIPTLETIEKAAQALGLRLEVALTHVP